MRAYLRAIRQARDARALELLDLIIAGVRGKPERVKELRRALGASASAAPAKSINLSGNRD